MAKYIKCEHSFRDPNCEHRKEAGMVWVGYQWLTPEAAERRREWQREWDRGRRQTPHVCQVKGCSEPAQEFTTGTFDNRCEYHKRRHEYRTYTNSITLRLEEILNAQQ